MKNTTINLNYLFYLTFLVWGVSFAVPSIKQDTVVQFLAFFYIFNISASALLSIFLLGANKAKLNHQLGERKHNSKWLTFIIHCFIDVSILISLNYTPETSYTKALFWFSLVSLVLVVANRILFERIKRRAQR